MKNNLINEIELTSISKENANELFLLDKECFSIPWSEESFLKEATNNLATYVIAKHNNKIVAYMGYWKVVDEGQITNIAVLKEYRGCGIAKKVLNEIIKKAKKDNLMSLSLEVRKSNTVAISLYSKFNFKIVGERKNYYQSPTEDAILMQLNL